MSRVADVYEQILRKAGRRAYRGIKKDARSAPKFFEEAEVLLAASPARLHSRMGLLVVAGKRVLYLENGRPQFAEFVQAVVDIRVHQNQDDPRFCRLSIVTPEQVQHVEIPIAFRDQILQAMREAQPQVGSRSRRAAEFVTQLRAEESLEQVRQLRLFAGAALGGNVLAYFLWHLEWPVMLAIFGIVVVFDERAKLPVDLRSGANVFLVPASLIAAVNLFLVLANRGFFS